MTLRCQSLQTRTLSDKMTSQCDFYSCRWGTKPDRHIHIIQHVFLVISLTLLRSVPYLRLSSSRVSLWSSCEEKRRWRQSQCLCLCVSAICRCVFNMPKSQWHLQLIVCWPFILKWLGRATTMTEKTFTVRRKESEWMRSQQKTQGRRRRKKKKGRMKGE